MGELTTAPGQVPANGDGADVEKRGDRRGLEPLDLAQNEDRATTGREMVERRPHGRLNYQRAFRVLPFSIRMTDVGAVTFPDSVTTPLVATNVDEYSDEPRLFPGQSTRHRRWRSRGPEKRILHEVPGIVDVGNETACEPVQPVRMGIEQRGQSFVAAHILLNADRPRNDGVTKCAKG